MTAPGSAWASTARGRLLPGDVPDAARTLGCDVGALLAVLRVEAAGSGFDAQGRPVILYEPHVMDRQLTKYRGQTALLRARAAALAYPRWGTRPYPPAGDARWKQFDQAFDLDPECACRATSWGLGQVLGENWQALGYGSALALARDAAVSETRQLFQVVKFIQSHGLADALHRQDWRAFAAGYNGTGQVDVYAAKLRAAYGGPGAKLSPAPSESDALNGAELDRVRR